MHKRNLLGALALSAMALTTGAAAANDTTITGTATYRERIAVPPGAVLDVRLVDISRADASAITLSARRYALSSVPAAFELAYDPALIRDGLSYAVQASIYDGPQLLFTTDTVHPVLTRGAGESVDLVLVRASVPGHAELENTKWSAFELNGAPLETEKRPEIAFAEGGQFSGSGSCNRFSGQAAVAEGEISFPDNMAATLMACPPPYDEVERAFFAALPTASTYTVDGDTLTLTNGAGVAVMRLTRMP